GRKNKAFTAFSASHRHDFSSGFPTEPAVVGRVSDEQTGVWSCVHRHKRIRRQQIEALMIPTRQRGMWQRGIVALHVSGRASQRRGYSRLTRVRKAGFLTIIRNMGKRKMGSGLELTIDNF